MKKKTIFTVLTLFTLPFFLTSQDVHVTGKVTDGATGQLLPYASIQLFTSDSTFAGGDVTNDEGSFDIKITAGSYYASIDFIGYKTYYTSVFVARDKSHSLGMIALNTGGVDLEEVVIEAEKSTMAFALDKRVFNVGKDLANAGGTASDLLSNIPSLNVDVDGSIKLRGSDNVRILIDGKPSGLVSFKGGAGLQQLQGNQIERVEIITNPSARYEAEGMAGIINIVLKKDQSQGFNGSFELILGQPVNYGVAANVNYRKNKLNFFLNYGLAYRKLPNIGSQYQEFYGPDTTFISISDRSGTVNGLHNNVQAGLDYFFNDKNILTASYLLRRTDVRRLTDITYDDYFNNTSNFLGKTLRHQDETETEPNSEIAVTYKKSYTNKGHELVLDLRYLDYWERSDQFYEQTSTLQKPNLNSFQKSLNDEFEKTYLAQLDYVKPIKSTGFLRDGKLETGLRTSFRDMTNDYLVTQRAEDGSFFTLQGLDNIFLYQENIHAAYVIIGDARNKFSYQLGARAEYTDIKTVLEKTNESNPRKYTNLFPSGHLTYTINDGNALQLSYSRRVRRPRYTELSPYITLSDNRNFFAGNPDLNPEFTDAFDLGHIKYFASGSIASSIFYRYTTDKIQSIRRVTDIETSTFLPENLLDENSFGVEITSQYSPINWWKGDLSFNFFRAITDGTNIGDDITSDTYSWFARHTSRFTLKNNTTLQMRANYEAPQQLPQGKRLEIFYIDIGASTDLFKGNGTITFNVSDVFNSRINRSEFNGVSFFTSSSSQFRRRQINLSLSYRIKQSKAKAKKSLISEE